MISQLLFVGTIGLEAYAAWILCGLVALILLRCIQVVDKTTTITDSDVSGALWWGLISLLAILIIVFCRMIHPVAYIPGWIGRILGISVTTNSPYANKGFFAKYLE